MTFLEKMSQQWQRMTGQTLDVTEETTEAEVLDQMEQQQPSGGDGSNDLEQLRTRLATLEQRMENSDGNEPDPSALTSEDLNQAIAQAVEPLTTRLDEQATTLTGLAKTVTDNHTATNKAINKLKLSSQGGGTPPAEPAPNTGGGDDGGDDGVTKMDMKDFMLGAKIRNGLI